MSFLSNVMRAVVNPATIAQLAMGPAGWASLAVRTIGAAIGKELISAIGQRLGLPQGVIGLAQTAFSAATGTTGGPSTIREAVNQLASQFNLSPTQAGNIERQANNSLESIRARIGSFASEAEETSGGKGKESFLVALAKAMGSLMDKKAAQMEKIAGQISSATDGGGSLSTSDQTKLSSKTALLQAYGQELGILSNAFSQVAKSFGDAQTTNARKG